jgi:hypothetical protein
MRLKLPSSERLVRLWPRIAALTAMRKAFSLHRMTNCPLGASISTEFGKCSSQFGKCAASIDAWALQRRSVRIARSSISA